MAARLEELNVTPEELERFKSAFQDVRFRELFAQYAEEISDPENRRRYEQEISEMERERGMDVQFLHPEPGHVLHTSLDGQGSCYLNICSNGLVRRPHCVPGTDREGRSGQHWSLPCSLSPAREELSPDGSREVIYDVIFHPDTLRLAANSDKFKAMVDLTALDTVSQSFHVVLDATNVRTLGEKYRGVPQACVTRKPRPGANPKQQDPGDPLSFPYPYDVPGGQRKSSRGHPKVQPQPEDRKANQEPTVPRYTIHHRSYVDMQDYRDARDSAPSPVPKELLITVDLPLLSSASEVKLHIEGKALSLESQKPAYKLQLKLPYLVEEERGTAQFNKFKRQLVITVPVVQQNLLKLMQEQLADVPEPESELSTSPDPEPQESDDTQESGNAPERPPSDKEPEGVEQPTTDGADAINVVLAASPECPIFTCSQDATSLTLVIHVKDIDEHSITSEVGSYECEIRFCVTHTNAPYVLFVQFLPQYNLNTNNTAVKVSEDNMVIELTKSSECFGLWKNLYFGVNSNSLQERRFINEENVRELLESGLRPSTIPWSTLEDQPLINVLEMNDERTRIQLNKPELEEESYLVPRERYAGLSDVKKQISYQSDETGLSDTGAEGSLQDPHPGVYVESPGRPFQTEHPSDGTCRGQQEDSGTEDEGLYFKEIPVRELDEDDIPDVTEQVQACVLQNSEPSPVLKEVDGSTPVASDHKTQCAFSFENALLFELD
ncbi:PREDICTED: protein kintoun [Nanorana parkeri]|uniref:protein kintoun n=1 Tax=Nanorana parkeri TaxID=125878 RepID=UPI000853F1CB|nr:PREDICTED: protein kintoun [Nanorana parkeri]